MTKGLLIASTLVCTGLIFWAGLSPATDLPPLLKGTGPSDLVLHALGFGALALPTALLLGPLLGGLATSLAAVALELLQHLAPSREASVPDAAAGLSGALLAALCIWVLARSRRGRA